MGRKIDKFIPDAVFQDQRFILRSSRLELQVIHPPFKQILGDK